MAEQKTKWILIDWNEREAHYFNSKDELFNHIKTFLIEWDLQDLEFASSDENMDATVVKCVPGQKPKEVIMEMEVKRVFSIKE